MGAGRRVSVSLPVAILAGCIVLLVVALAATVTALVTRGPNAGSNPGQGAAAVVSETPTAVADTPTLSTSVAASATAMFTAISTETGAAQASPSTSGQSFPTVKANDSQPVIEETPTRTAPPLPTSTPTAIPAATFTATPTPSPTAADVPLTDGNTVRQLAGGAVLPSGITFRQCVARLFGSDAASDWGVGVVYLGNGLWRADYSVSGAPDHVSVFYNERTGTTSLGDLPTGYC